MIACSGGAGELGEVVGGTDQGPFGLYVVDATQQKLSEPSCLLDLSEHRLDHLLAQAIAAAMAGASEPLGHCGQQRAGFGRSLGGGGFAAVLLASGGDVAF